MAVPGRAWRLIRRDRLGDPRAPHHANACAAFRHANDRFTPRSGGLVAPPLREDHEAAYASRQTPSSTPPGLTLRTTDMEAHMASASASRGLRFVLGAAFALASAGAVAQSPATPAATDAPIVLAQAT